MNTAKFENLHSRIMNIKKLKISKKLPVTASLVTLIIVLVSSTAEAQKAPDFSNDLLMDDQTLFFFMADRLEYNVNSGLNPIVLDAQGYIGKDINKFWFEAEGEALTAETEGEVELEALYSRAITPYFDLQAGIRYDIVYNANDTRTRGFAVVGIQGLAPYFFEVDGNLFVSEEGDISAAFEAEYDLLFTQRLIGQPIVETSIALQEVEEWGVGSGFNDIGLGFRLRYEILREFAPYIGINWERKLGKTADMARTEGGEVSSFSLLGGVRMWF